ncbi:MAG: prolipoprotein diacylglyceryl transferase [Candidatus Margulisbacteria bacterium]|nr:prolipoprotein diacylglyceryl transferase [Candidatus Margulisiibacteriota bacterium]
MQPILFKLGALELHSYGLFVALGFTVGIILSLIYAKREKIAAQLIVDLALYVVLAAIAGARLFYVLGQPAYYFHNPLEIIMVQNGGLVFLGGLFLAILAVVVFARQKNIPLLNLLDAITPGTALGYAIGRLGCFFNGCCFGLPTNLPWGITFPSGSLAAFYCPNERLHPTQLYSSLIVLILFLGLLWLYKNKKFSGQIFFSGLVGYALYRFLIEFLRYSPIHWLALTPSQWLAIIMLIFGLWGLVHFRYSDIRA